MKIYLLYRRWGKLPWEMGYGHLQELYNIMPFIIAHVDIIRQKQLEKAKQDQKNDLEYEKVKSKVHKYK